MSFAAPDSTLMRLINTRGFVPLVGFSVLSIAVWVAMGGLNIPPIEQPQPVGPNPIPPGETPYPTGQDGQRFPGQDRPPAEAPRPTYH